MRSDPWWKRESSVRRRCRESGQTPISVPTLCCAFCMDTIGAPCICHGPFDVGAHFTLPAHQKLGKGGMGELFLAEDTTLHRKVAIQFLPSAVANEQALATLKTIPEEFYPAITARQMARTLFNRGQRNGAAAVAEECLKKYKDEGGQYVSMQAMFAAASGDEATANARIASATKEQKGYIHFHHTAYNIASAYALMGKAEPAMKWLHYAADNDYPSYALFQKRSESQSHSKRRPFDCVHGEAESTVGALQGHGVAHSNRKRSIFHLEKSGQLVCLGPALISRSSRPSSHPH